MKELFIIRHAKSSWDNPSINDFDRPLNTRGLHDAAEMAERLASKDISLDFLITSDAKRAYNTAIFFAIRFPNAKLETVHKLYNASSRNFYKIIENISNKYNSVAIFSHNTGITDFVNQLTNVHVDIVPTCGIYAIKIDVDNWKDFGKSEKAFWFFDYPKNIIR